MPFYSEYSITRRLPPRLQYANGAIIFEIVEVPFLGSRQWVFQARKVQAEASTCVIATSVHGQSHLAERLAGGFVLDEATPAAKIMARLVNEGFATRRAARREH